MDVWHYITSGAVAIIGYFLREKHLELKEVQADSDHLEERIHALETRAAVNDEGNKNRDNKVDSMDKKLDRLLEKLGA